MEEAYFSREIHHCNSPEQEIFDRGNDKDPVFAEQIGSTSLKPRCVSRMNLLARVLSKPKKASTSATEPSDLGETLLEGMSELAPFVNLRHRQLDSGYGSESSVKRGSSKKEPSIADRDHHTSLEVRHARASVAQEVHARYEHQIQQQAEEIAELQSNLQDANTEIHRLGFDKMTMSMQIDHTTRSVQRLTERCCRLMDLNQQLQRMVDARHDKVKVLRRQVDEKEDEIQLLKRQVRPERWTSEMKRFS